MRATAKKSYMANNYVANSGRVFWKLPKVKRFLYLQRGQHLSFLKCSSRQSGNSSKRKSIGGGKNEVSFAISGF